MARNPKASIDIRVNEKPALEGLQRLQDGFTSTVVQMNAAMEVAGKVFGAANAAISAVVDTVSEYVELAMEQERVERRAIAAIQARQTFSRAELDLLQQANAARQQQLGIGDEVQLQLQGTMAAMGVTKGQLDAATRAAIGLSEAMGMGLEEASKVAAKAFTGNVGALAEYGIKAKSAADAQQQLNAMFDVAIANGRSLETRLAVLNANVGDFKEVLGGAVTESGALKDGLDAMSSALLELQGYFASAEGREAVNGFFGVILDLTSDAIDAMLGAYKMVQELRGEGDRKGFLSRLGGAAGLVTTTGPIGAIRSLISGRSPLQQAREDLDQLLGRGEARTVQSPMLLALENLADNLRKAALAAREAKQEVLGGPARRAGGGGAGEPMPEVTVELGRIRDARLAALENEIQTQMQIEDGLRSALAEHQAALLREQADIQRQIETEAVNERNQARMDAYAQEQAAMQAHYQVLGDLSKQGAGIVSGNISELLVAWASGADMAEMTVGRFVGTILMQLGTMLIQTSVAAGVMGLLSLIPGLQGIAGPPGMGFVAGAAALTAGVGMVALGAAMGGAGARGGSSAAPRAASGGAAAGAGFDPVPRGFSSAGRDMSAAPSYNVNVSFGVVGDERRAARMIRDVLERGR